jgi:hypothetical protein
MATAISRAAAKLSRRTGNRSCFGCSSRPSDCGSLRLSVAIALIRIEAAIVLEDRLTFGLAFCISRKAGWFGGGISALRLRGAFIFSAVDIATASWRISIPI